MNLLTAFILFTFLALIGIPKIIENQFTVARDTKVIRSDVLVGYVSDGSPAQKAGLKSEDRLVAIEDNTGKKEYISQTNKLIDITKKFAGKDVVITVTRQGDIKNLKAQLRTEKDVKASEATDKPIGYLGVTQANYTEQRSTWSAPIVAAGLIKQFTELTLKGLGSLVGNLFRGNAQEATKQVSGPIGIFVIIRDGSLLGIRFILMIVAIISLTLAIMNALPIPALDGGRLFVTLLYRVMRKPLTKEVEEKIHGTGMIFILGAAFLISIVDVRRFF
jgi:regulator of sigma E protease